MTKILKREDCLQLDIEIYNKVIELQWQKDKIEKNLSGDLSICEYCNRKHSICCICNKAEEQWNIMIEEIKLKIKKL